MQRLMAGPGKRELPEKLAIARTCTYRIVFLRCESCLNPF
jgi:hypothetical protein